MSFIYEVNTIWLVYYNGHYGWAYIVCFTSEERDKVFEKYSQVYKEVQVTEWGRN